jgi:hypothetical protein
VRVRVLCVRVRVRACVYASVRMCPWCAAQGACACVLPPTACLPP